MGREGCIQTRSRRGDPEAVGPDQARAVLTDEVEEPCFACCSLWADLGKAGGDDAERPRSRSKGLLHGLQDVGAGKAEDSELDRRRNVPDRRVTRHVVDSLSRAVDRIRLTSETRLADIRKTRPPIEPGRPEAPTTATESGEKNGRREAMTPL